MSLRKVKTQGRRGPVFRRGRLVNAPTKKGHPHRRPGRHRPLTVDHEGLNAEELAAAIDAAVVKRRRALRLGVAARPLTRYVARSDVRKFLARVVREERDPHTKKIVRAHLTGYKRSRQTERGARFGAWLDAELADTRSSRNAGRKPRKSRRGKKPRKRSHALTGARR